MEDEVFLRVQDVIKMTTLSQAEIYRRATSGAFPKQIKISERRVVWRKSEVQNWMKNIDAR